MQEAVEGLIQLTGVLWLQPTACPPLVIDSDITGSFQASLMKL